MRTLSGFSSVCTLMYSAAASGGRARSDRRNVVLNRNSSSINTMGRSLGLPGHLRIGVAGERTGTGNVERLEDPAGLSAAPTALARDHQATRPDFYPQAKELPSGQERGARGFPGFTVRA